MVINWLYLQSLEVRVGLASSPHTPTEILEALVEDYAVEVLRALAANPNSTPTIFNLLVDCPYGDDPEILYKKVLNPSCPATHVGCALTGHAEGQTERMAQFAIANTGLTVEERGKVIQTAKECCGYNFGEGVFQWQTAVPEE